MKFTYNWIKDYLDTDIDAAGIANTLTSIGLEIDEVSYPVRPIAAKITECVKHPAADNLNVLTLDDGSGVPRVVVCGAPNVRVGLVSALARPGCVIGGLEIKQGKVRGIQSNGMMCSPCELGISDDHTGIIELDPRSETIGKTISLVDDSLDAVFDAGITPNRPDYLGVAGIARDLFAAGIGKLKPDTIYEKTAVAGARSAIIKNTDACSEYHFVEIRDIKITESNANIKSRLGAIGITPRNAPVDATNYICYDLCQPMHCFDADGVIGNILVRDAICDEEFTDLFGKIHKLSDTDLVISDDAGILALAGVIGGMRAGVTDTTKNIILESAYFAPGIVRASAKRAGISTDASYRYERGIDRGALENALWKCVKIIMDACGGQIIGTYSAIGTEYSPIKIQYNPEYFYKKTGIDIIFTRQLEILTGLGFDINTDALPWLIVPLARRVDVCIPENIVAELARIYGYDKITGATKKTESITIQNNDLNISVKRKLVARGLSEHISFGFGNSADSMAILDANIVRVSNPINSDFDIMRNNLISNILRAISNNCARGYPDLNMFELGTVFDGANPGEEHTQLVIARTGESPRHWQKRGRAMDIYDIRADLLNIIGNNGISVRSENPPKWAHPYRYGAIFYMDNMIAEFGQLHPMIMRHFQIKTNTQIGLIGDISKLPNWVPPKQIPISEFQPIARDFAFVMDSDFMADKLLVCAMSADTRISDAIIFDNFDMGDGKRSIGFSITIIPNTNMSDVDLLEIQNKIIETIEENCPAKLRA